MVSQSEKEALQPETNAQRLDRWFATILRGFVLAIFVIHPLLIMPDIYFTIVDIKRAFFSVLLVVVLLALLLLALKANSMAPGYLKWPGLKGIFQRMRPYEYALLAYWLVMVVSTIFSDYPLKALMGSSINNEGLLMQSAYLLTAVIVGRLYRPNENHLMVFCAVATVVAVIGIFQFYNVDFLNLNRGGIEDTNFGPTLLFVATMSNKNILSTYLCLAFCFAVGMFARFQRKIHWAYLPIAWIIFYMLMLGDTESGYVGVMVALAVLFPFLAVDRKSAGRLLFLLGGCLLLLVVVDWSYTVFGWSFFFHSLLPYLLVLGGGMVAASALLFFAPLPALPRKGYVAGWYLLLVLGVVVGVSILPSLAEKTENRTLIQAAEILDGNLDDSFGSNRIFIWRRAVTLIPEHPLIGHGPDHFFIKFDDKFGREASEKHGVYYDKAHNEYIQFAVDEGLLGLGCMLAFYGLLLWQAWKRYRQPMMAALLFAMVCFVVQAFFNFSTPLAHPVIWCLWGVMAAGTAEFAETTSEMANASLPPEKNILLGTDS